MTRLSSPESVLRKIESVQDRIETLYAVVDRIRELRERLEETATAAAAKETTLGERLESLGALEAEYRAAAERLSSLADETARGMERVRTELEWERDGVRETLKTFGEERERHRVLRAVLEGEIRAAARETATGTAYLEARVDAGVREMALSLARERDEMRADLASALAGLRDEAALVREEAFYLEDRLEAFRTALSDRFDRRVDLLAERQRIFREEASREIHARFDEASGTLADRAEAAEAELRAAGDAERERVSEAVAFLGDERREAETRREEAAAEAERLRAEIEAMAESARNRTDRTIADLTAVAAREVNHVAAFVADAETQFRGLRGELGSFRDRMAAAVDEGIETFRNEEIAFRDALRRELDDRVSERLRTVEGALDRGMAALSAERKSTDELHRALEETVAQVNRRIRERTTFFGSRLNNLIVEAQRELSASAEESRSRVDERIRALGVFADKQRAGLGKLRDQLRGFAETMRNRLDADRERRDAEIAAFRSEIEERVDARILREVERRSGILRSELEERLDADADARRTEAAAARERAEAVEGRMGALEGSQAEAEAALRQRMSGVKKAVKGLMERQEAADRSIPALEARIAALEEALRNRKGLFPFAGRKREESQ
jgi:chromosome segregation ATPase